MHYFDGSEPQVEYLDAPEPPTTKKLRSSEEYVSPESSSKGRMPMPTLDDVYRKFGETAKAAQTTDVVDKSLLFAPGPDQLARPEDLIWFCKF